MALDYATNPAVFDKEVVLLREHLITDSAGNQRSVWHPFANVFAAIEPLRWREYWQAAQAQSEATVRIIIRYRKGVNDRMRILYRGVDGNVIYEMKSAPINYNEKNMYLELMCAERIMA